MKPPPIQAPAAPALDRRYVTAALMLIMSLASMEQTVTATAMPTIIGDLHGVEHYSWVASVYLLAATVLMPLWGRLADAFGRKRIILIAIGLFALGSVLCGFAASMAQLIVFRGVQGLGAGGVMPVILTILGDIFTLEQRARIQGWFSALWGISALTGPALGALFVQTVGWRWIFFINLPLGLLGLLVLVWKYHEHEKPHHTNLDLPGVLSLAVGCTALLALVSRLGPGGWPWPIAAGLVVVTLASIVFFLWHERRAAHPVMPMSLLTHRMIGPSMAGTALLGLGVLCVETYVPLYVQGGRGGGATAAAGAVTPVLLTWAITNVVAARLLVRWGFRRMALLGSSMITLSFAGLVLCATQNLGHTALTITLCLAGLGFGPCSMSFLLAAQEAVEWRQRGSVTSNISFFRTIGGAIGIGVLGALLQTRIAPGLASLRDRGITPAEALDPHAAEAFPPEVLSIIRDSIAGAMVWVFAGMLVFAAIQIAIAALLPARHAEHKINAAEAMEALG